jgi:hypothetical protein
LETEIIELPLFYRLSRVFAPVAGEVPVKRCASEDEGSHYLAGEEISEADSVNVWVGRFRQGIQRQRGRKGGKSKEMFKALAKSVRAELRQEGQDPGLDQSGEQSSKAEREGPVFTTDR